MGFGQRDGGSQDAFRAFRRGTTVLETRGEYQRTFIFQPGRWLTEVRASTRKMRRYVGERRQAPPYLWIRA